jgi:NDP-sugar pyrophosphorylase family protein
MFPFTTRWPKPILPVMGKPLLQHQIEMMKSVGIEQVFIVIGHLGYEIVRALSKVDLGVKIEYIEQTEALGIAHAVGRLESKIQKPFLLSLGDIFFISSTLSSVFQLYGQNGTRAVLVSKREDRPEQIRRNFAIVTGADSVVQRVIEKPGYVQTKYMGCGIYLFGLEIFDAVRRTPRTAMRDEYEITESIQIMINDGHRVMHADIVEDDLNVTVPEDLLLKNLEELKRLGLPNFSVNPSIDLTGISACVIGKNAVIQQPVQLQNCVIFEEAIVPSGTKLTNAIITPDGLIQCNL